MPAIREALYIAQAGRPAGLVDITKDAQQASLDWDWDGVRSSFEGKVTARADCRQPPACGQLIRSARKPLTCGAGVQQSGASPSCASSRNGLTRPCPHAAGIGSVSGEPFVEPRRWDARRGLGHHAESRKPTCCWPSHALRRSRDRQYPHLRAAGEEDSHRYRPVRASIRTSPWTRDHRRSPRDAARICSTSWLGATTRRGSRTLAR